MRVTIHSEAMYSKTLHPRPSAAWVRREWSSTRLGTRRSQSRTAPACRKRLSWNLGCADESHSLGAAADADDCDARNTIDGCELREGTFDPLLSSSSYPTIMRRAMGG